MRILASMTTSDVPKTAGSSKTPPRRKVFRGVALPERPTIVLEGINGNEEEFLGQPSMPGVIALTLATDGMSANTIPSFFEAVIQPEDHDRFNKFCADPANGINIEVLVEIATYLIEEYTGRPTEPSSE
jgi:hypothetical protein